MVQLLLHSLPLLKSASSIHNSNCPPQQFQSIPATAPQTHNHGSLQPFSNHKNSSPPSFQAPPAIQLPVPPPGYEEKKKSGQNREKERRKLQVLNQIIITLSSAIQARPRLHKPRRHRP
jgi:hypothetical protein